MSEPIRGRLKKEKDEVMKVCSLRLPPQVLEELREVAEQTDRTVGQTMRRIIETFLADYKHSERIDTDDDDKDPSDYILALPEKGIEVTSV